MYNTYLWTLKLFGDKLIVSGVLNALTAAITLVSIVTFVHTMSGSFKTNRVMQVVSALFILILVSTTIYNLVNQLQSGNVANTIISNLSLFTCVSVPVVQYLLVREE